MKTTVGILLALLIVAPAAYATDIAVITAVDANCYPLYYGAQVTIEGLVVSGTELGSAGLKVVRYRPVESPSQTERNSVEFVIRGDAAEFLSFLRKSTFLNS